jgi:hypothetical protein
MVFSIFQANNKAKAAEVNDNFAFISGNRLIAINASTGAPIGTFPIGDLTAITNGSLAGNLLGRTGSSLKVYSATGVLIGSVSYDSLLNLQDASETQKGVARFATAAEIIAGTDATKSITPAALAGSVSFVKGATGYEQNAQGFIRNFGVVSLAAGAATTITLPKAFPNVFTVAFAQGESENTNEDPAGALRATLSQIRVSNGFAFTANIMWEAYGY